MQPKARPGADLFDQLSKLGPLEIRIIKALWKHGTARVKDLHHDFPDLAYTTLMTTLDRLYRKGVLGRVSDGRAFAYCPRVTASDLQAGAAAHVLRSLTDSHGTVEAVLSFLLDQLGADDAAALSELERLVRERRRALGKRLE